MPDARRRSPEASALFNPAFTSLLIHSAIVSHDRESAAGMAWPVSFLVLPLVMHESTRLAFPRTVRKTFVAWIHENPDVRSAFAPRAQALTGVTRQALRNLLRQSLIEVSGARFRASGRRVRSATQPVHGQEVVQCVRAATLVGRWMATVEPVTAMGLLGVRP